MKKIIYILVLFVLAINLFSQTQNQFVISKPDYPIPDSNNIKKIGKYIIEVVGNDTIYKLRPFEEQEVVKVEEIQADKETVKRNNMSARLLNTSHESIRSSALNLSQNSVMAAIDKNKAVGEIPVESNIINGFLVYNISIQEYAHKLAPNLSIAYNSVGQNRDLGMGWSLDGLEKIEVVSENYYYNGQAKPEDLNSDIAFTLNGIRLIKQSSNSEYVSYVTETDYIKVRYYAPSKKYYFKVYYPDGAEAVFGYTGTTTPRWDYPITKKTDRFGYFCNYSYSEYNSYSHISSINYGVNNVNVGKIDFSYTTKPDPVTFYKAGNKITISRQLTKIDTWFQNTKLKSYSLKYNLKTVSLLTEIGCIAGTGNEELNPLKFEYGDPYTPDNFSTEFAFLKRYFPGDEVSYKSGNFYATMPGTGIITYPEKEPYTLLQGNVWGSNYHPDQNLLVYKSVGAGQEPMVIPAEEGFQTLFAGDTNGNGEDELVKVNTWCEGRDRTIIHVQIWENGKAVRGKTFAVGGSMGWDGRENLIPRRFEWGDFIGNGKIQLLAVSSREVETGDYGLSFITLIDLENLTMIYNKHNLPNEGICYNAYDTDQLHVADIDGDGKQELIHLNPYGAWIFTWQGASLGFKYKYYSKINSNIATWGVVKWGDFNNDGKADYIRYQAVNSTKWTIGYSKGNGDFEEQTVNMEPYYGEKQYVIYDLNGDGYNDMLVFDDKIISSGSKLVAYLNENGKFNTTPKQTYINLERGNKLIPGNTSCHFWGSYSSQILAMKNGWITPITYNRNDAQQRMISKSTNSLGVESFYTYQHLTGHSSFTNTAYNKPYVKKAINLNIINNTYSRLGNTTIKNEYYWYRSPVTHMQGLGFSGFEEIEITDNLRNEKIKYTYNPAKFGILTNISSSLVETDMEYNVDIKSNKQRSITLLKNKTTDKLQGYLTEKKYEYDLYDNMVVESVKLGGYIQQSTYTTYDNIDTNSLYLLGIVRNKTTESKRRDKMQVNNVVYEHNDKYLPASEKNSYNGNLVSENNYLYSSMGTITSQKNKAYSSTKWLETTYEYDNIGRLKKSTNPLGLSVENTYYTENGLLKEEIDHKDRKTIHEYNKWGVRTRSEYPDGTLSTEEWGWTDISSIGAFVMKKTIMTGKPTNINYLDALGRTVRESEIRFDNSELKTDILYDNLGRILKKSQPFTTTTAGSWNTYEYDKYDRVTAVNYASGRKDTYSYDLTTVETVIDGLKSKTTYDASGQVIQVEDNGGVIEYYYNADNNLSTIKAPGENITIFEYDKYGRKIAIDDPSAGKRTYIYDDRGNLIQETNADNKVIKMQYNDYGFMTRYEAVGEETVVYDYDLYGQLLSQTGGNHSLTFSYDDLDRIKTRKETVADGKWIEISNQYLEGNLKSTSYTSNSSGKIADLSYTYSNGHLTKISLNGATDIWRLDQENSMGLVQKVTSGSTASNSNGALTRYYEHDQNGLPTVRKVSKGNTIIQHFTYKFDERTRNLTWRKDNTRNIQENFSYDNLNRLTNFNDVTLTYDSQGMGNIVKNSQSGEFQYGANKAYQLIGMENLNNYIPVRSQQITYNSLSRPLSIIENGIKASFLYNSEGKRVKMQVTKNNANVITRYYIGKQYETETGITGNKEMLYLDGDPYNASTVYVKENNKWGLYYICRDYLGNITHITDGAGNLKQELSYNPWGVLRNPTNQQAYAYDSQPVLFLSRGYTGHEHLPWFGLINMNARLYDPVVGRFLSVDPYVQNPYDSQNFNRYSYCLNNPLKYNDENGEFFKWIAGAVSGFWKGVFRGKNIFKSTWDGFRNAVKTDVGLFKGNSRQIFSRFSKELPQTIIGNYYSHYRNIKWTVDKVRYFDGATYLINESSAKRDGITLGSYININIRDKYDKNRYEPNGKFTPINDPLFMHEYGHYLQSQQMGLKYLFKVGIPSIKSAKNSEVIEEYNGQKVKNSDKLTTHDIFGIEMDANRRAAAYFGVNNDWDNLYPDFPTYNPFESTQGPRIGIPRIRKSRFSGSIKF